MKPIDIFISLEKIISIFWFNARFFQGHIFEKVGMLIHAISRRLQLHQQLEIMEWVVQLPKMTDGCSCSSPLRAACISGLFKLSALIFCEEIQSWLGACLCQSRLKTILHFLFLSNVVLS